MPFSKQCMRLRWIKCDFMANGSTWMVYFLKSPREVFTDVPQKWRELSCSPWTMNPFPAGGRGNQPGHVDPSWSYSKDCTGFCSPIVVYVIPFILGGMVSIVQMNNWSSGRISDFPSHRNNWKCRNSNPDHLTLSCSRYVSTPCNWHKQRFMC